MTTDSPAIGATLVTLGVVALLLSAGTAVGVAVTGGEQPVMRTERVPAAPDAAVWEDAASRTVDLSTQRMALPYGGGSVDRLRVQAVTNETHVAFRLSWTDPTNDTTIDEPGAYSDAAAIMLKGGQQPPITMGAAGEPVNIWYWRAQWGMANHTATGDMYVYPHPDERTMPGRAAGNPLSRAEYDRLAQNYYARGYGSLSHASEQNVDATAERTDDGWTVVFVRERSTDGVYDAAFNESSQLYLAFAVWNGSADEVNGRKSITMQFSTLDTNGTLAAAQTGDGGGEPGGAATPGGGATTPTGWLPQPFGRYLVLLLTVVIVTWWFAFLSIYRRQR